MTVYVGDAGGLSWSAAAAKVRGDLWRSSGSLVDDVVYRALHASILELEANCQWIWLEDIEVVTVVDDPTAKLDIPGSVSRVSSVSVKRPSGSYPLVRAPLEAVRMTADLAHGEPFSWAHGDGVIWLDATAPVDMAFEIIASFQTPETVSAAIVDPNPTLQRYEDTVLAGACARIALRYLKNGDEAARQRSIFEADLDRIQSVEADRRGGLIQPDTWGSRCG